MLQLPKNNEYIETSCYYTWLGSDNICRTKAKDGAEVHLKEARENSVAVLSFHRDKKYPILVDATQIKSIDKEARDFFSLQNRPSPVNAIAIIIGSPISRVIGNFFIGLNKSRVPNKLFTAEKPAIEWLSNYMEE